MGRNYLKPTSILLTLCMIFGLLPGYVFAENTSLSSNPSSSLEDYLTQQLEGVALKLDDNDLMMAFGLP